jgi:excinuclease ABC subunit C
MIPSVAEKLALLPDRPGVYLFRDAAGHILYVGKAVSLKSRVRSYFQAGRGLEGKVQAMVAQVADLEHIVTDSEVEALILESDLIKQHRPKYNIRLRDDKQYPFLRVGVGEPWPRLELVRRTRSDGARYFGPFPHSSAVWETMHTLRRVFPYRSCSDRRLARGEACLYHHIHRCLAPCIGACTPQAYGAMIGELAQFLEGRGEAVLHRLEARMHEAAEAERFEEAADVRDRLLALRSVLEKQKIASLEAADRDVVALARAKADAAVQVFFVRQGRIAGRDGFMLAGADGLGDGEVLGAFLKQYYGGGAAVPREVLLAAEPEDAAAITAWLGQRRGGPVRLRVPRRGDKRRLVELVASNAAEVLQGEQWRRERSRAAAEAALAELQEALDLPARPERIECFDISHIQGCQQVGAMAVFEGGVPCRADYRRFRIRTVDGSDDFRCLQEVLSRRFRRGLAERREAASADGEVAGFARLPDLIVIDGGRGQLSHGREVLRELGLERIPTFGLAKENEWLFAEGSAEPVVLPRTSPALHLLQRLRDETHRFAVTYHRQLRGKASVASLLEEVPGIGPARRKALLKQFGSLEALRGATVDDLAAVPGMSRPAAEELASHLGRL